MYLLAVACMIESRLGSKAYVYGDITRGQCRKAVELANRHLSKPVTIPARCDKERLYERVSKLPLTPSEQIYIFEVSYLGAKDAEFGNFLRSKYPPEVFEAYWQNQFNHCTIDTVLFDDVVEKYIRWGFDLLALCGYVNFQGKDGTMRYETFIRFLLDTKLHRKEKNCKDILRIDQEEERPYTTATQFAQFFFAGARNRKVNRYIPIEELRSILKQALGNKCDVDKIMNECLSKETDEKDCADRFLETMDAKRQEISEERETYDITEYSQLMFYERGDRLPEKLEKNLGATYKIMHSVSENDETYHHLMSETPYERYKFWVEHNQAFHLRDKDWERIYTNIHENKDSYSRYYFMTCIRIEGSDQKYAIRAMILNDELHTSCGEFLEKYAEEIKKLL